MNDVIEQFNECLKEIKPTRHQRALKMVVLKALQAENSKRRRKSWDSFLSFFSMSSIKTLVTGAGVAVLAVAIVIGWNPLLQRLGFKHTKTSQASAQELLKLTREQYNALSAEERKRLTQSVQEKNLEYIWHEAEQASDLRFLQNEELLIQKQRDFQNIFSVSASSSTQEKIDKFSTKDKVKVSAFRYTDPQGRITYLTIRTDLTAPKNLIIDSKTTIYVFKAATSGSLFNTQNFTEVEQQAKALTLQITPEQIKVAEHIMEQELSHYFPEVAQKWLSGRDRHSVLFSMGDVQGSDKNNQANKKYIDIPREKQMNDKQSAVYIFDPDGRDLLTLYAFNAYFIDEEGKHYHICAQYHMSSGIMDLFTFYKEK